MLYSNPDPSASESRLSVCLTKRPAGLKMKASPSPHPWTTGEQLSTMGMLDGCLTLLGSGFAPHTMGSRDSSFPTVQEWHQDTPEEH